MAEHNRYRLEVWLECIVAGSRSAECRGGERLISFARGWSPLADEKLEGRRYFFRHFLVKWDGPSMVIPPRSDFKVAGSQSVPEERALVTHIQQLLIGIHRSYLFVSLAGHEFVLLFVLLSVRYSQDVSHHNRTAAYRQADTESERIPWCLCSNEDVAATNAS